MILVNDLVVLREKRKRVCFIPVNMDNNLFVLLFTHFFYMIRKLTHVSSGF
jgi:hypothetical protein